MIDEDLTDAVVSDTTVGEVYQTVMMMFSQIFISHNLGNEERASVFWMRQSFAATICKTMTKHNMNYNLPRLSGLSECGQGEREHNIDSIEEMFELISSIHFE